MSERDGQRASIGCWGIFFIACVAVLFMRTCCPGACVEEPCNHEATKEAIP